MVRSTFHYLAIHSAIFNVYLTDPLSDHVQVPLFGMHVLMFVIGQHYLQLAVVIQATVHHHTVVVTTKTATITVHHHMVLTTAIHQAVDHLIHMDARNAQQRNVRNAAVLAIIKAMVKAIVKIVDPLRLFLKCLWVSS